MRTLPLLSLALGICASLPPAATAQVPPGHVVLAGVGHPASPTGNGGLWVTHPRLGTTLPITGLPPALTGQNSMPPGGGSIGVSYWAEQDALLVGSVTLAGNGPPQLWVVYLNGLAYDPSRSYAIPLGTVCTGGAGFSVARIIGRLSPSQVLVVLGPDAVCPGNEQLLVVDLVARGVVSGVAVTPRPPTDPRLAGAYDGAGTAYICFNEYNPPTTTLMAVSVATGAATTLRVFSVGGPYGGIHGLLWDARSSRLVAAISVHTSPTRLSSHMLWLDPTTGATTRARPVPSGTGRALAAEPASDGWLAVRDVPGPKPLEYVDSFGVGHSLTTVSDILGLAVVPNPKTYGAPSPATSALHWEVWPNPGGLPQVGNAAFGLQLRGGGEWWLASATRGNTPVAGIDLLLGTPVLVTDSVPPSGLIPLAIPNAAGLVGGSLCFQGVSLSPGGQLSASDGVELTIMQ